METKTRMVFMTGDGKGKTSSALGMVLRAAGHGMPVCLIQFIKNCPEIGEIKALRLFPCVELHQCGAGFVMPGETRKLPCHRSAAEAGLALAAARLRDPAVAMVVLDEVGSALSLGLIALADVLAALDGATPGKIIVVTGHEPVAELIARADTVSEIRCLKHGYAAGFPAQQGVEL